MILPGKHLPIQNALLWIGGEILQLLDEPKTVSRLWHDVKLKREESFGAPSITYSWFVLALDLLYALGAVETDRGRIIKRLS